METVSMVQVQTKFGTNTKVSRRVHVNVSLLEYIDDIKNQELRVLLQDDSPMLMHMGLQGKTDEITMPGFPSVTERSGKFYLSVYNPFVSDENIFRSTGIPIDIPRYFDAQKESNVWYTQSSHFTLLIELREAFEYYNEKRMIDEINKIISDPSRQFSAKQNKYIYRLLERNENAFRIFLTET